MKEAIAAEPNEQLKLSFECMRLAYLYGTGATENLEKLLSLKNEHPNSTTPIEWIAYCYRTAGDYRRGAEVYERALSETAWPTEDYLRLLSSLVESLRKDKRPHDALQHLNASFERVTTEAEKSEVHKLIADVYADLNDKASQHWNIEKALELNPGDVVARFELAHDYSEVGNALLALYHYQIVENQRGWHGEMNNIGLILTDLDLPITTVQYFQRAFDHGGSLAAGNLARHAARSGFVKQAKEILDQARKLQNVEEYVHQMTASVSTWEEAEAKRFGTIKEASTTAHQVSLRRYELEKLSGTSITREGIEGIWVGSSTGDITISDITFRWENNQLRATLKTAHLWDWKLTGAIEGRVYSFTWENDHKSQNTNGTGYLMWPDDDYFEGIIYDYPSKGEVLTVSGRSRKPLPQKVEIFKGLPIQRE